jgi:peptidoglycan/LPS O-acetylase OafA/YrhL
VAWFWLSVPLRFGYWGVTLFLVLSGFCIHLTVARRMARGEGVRAEWGRFWKRRFWRLYPPYVAAIIFSLAVSLAVGTSAYDADYQRPQLAWDLLTHLLMVHNLLTDFWQGLGNMALWSLGLEEQLYALYAVYLALRRRYAAVWVTVCTLTISLAWICLSKWVSGPRDWGGDQPSLTIGPIAFGQWMMWPFAWWFAWTLGAIAAEAYTGAIRLPAWCANYFAAVALTLAAIGCNRIILQHLSLRYSASVERLSHMLGDAPLDSYLVVLIGFSEVLCAVAAFVLLNR